LGFSLWEFGIKCWNGAFNEKFNISICILVDFIFCFSQQNLKRDITKIIQSKNALVAVSVMNSKGKTEVNINGNKKVPMLSVFKFHIALAVLDLVDRGILDLEQNIFVKKSELLENTWSPIRDKYPNGNVNIPLREII